ncbi:hypothetical protein N431DRAFT_413709 [Stipitochalara longipes BDJ]|nr:hypothetical protein N431DRAFT_413709 [Stipitochalara longipes BDJ]
MLHLHVLKNLSMSRSQGLLAFLQDCKAYSSWPSSDSEAADLDAARDWFRRFNKSTIPAKIAKTEFSRSGGAGGQKVNKTSSKATTVWELHALFLHVPKVLHPGLRDSKYYVHSSDSIQMQCDSSRSQSENRAKNHQKLLDELTRIYKQRVPGVTAPEQLKKIEQLQKSSPEPQYIKYETHQEPEIQQGSEVVQNSYPSRFDSWALIWVCHHLLKRAENSARLRTKKLHADKKRARTGGGGGRRVD